MIHHRQSRHGDSLDVLQRKDFGGCQSSGWQPPRRAAGRVHGYEDAYTIDVALAPPPKSSSKNVPDTTAFSSSRARRRNVVSMHRSKDPLSPTDTGGYVRAARYARFSAGRRRSENLRPRTHRIAHSRAFGIAQGFVER